MTLRKFLKGLVGLFFIIIIAFVVIYKTHPIILKWLYGTAGLIGKPIHVSVYTNGRINNDIKVFHTNKYWDTNEKADNYILYLKEFDSLGMLKFFNINLKEKWIGRPVGTSVYDYDFVFGRLFQSETGGHFTPFQDDMKGFDFDPQLSFTDKQIKFNVPPNWLKFDSVRIELQ
ncbi:MAG: hypothetical protein JST58_10335 [Bacteroidetes bacterium]|nr:hypothetical protein [Bacteroidota bacterium]